MNLLLDIGHSRAKLGVSGEEKVKRTAVLPLAEVSRLHGEFEKWRDQVTNLMAVCMLHGEQGDVMRAQVERYWGAPVCWVDSNMVRGDIQLSYEKLETFGADRLLALQAARQRTDGACIVVDAGSAVTVDGVTGSGRHVGGWIVPGHLQVLASMMDLLPLDSDVSAKPSEAGFQSTEQAVAAGIWKTLAAGVDQMCARCQDVLQGEGGEKVEIFVTGGDASALQDWCQTKMVLFPMLVLEGLRLFPKGI